MSTTAQPATTPIDPELPAPLSMREVLSYPMLRRLWYAQIVSVFGDFLALFAVIGVLTFNLHATAQQVTLRTPAELADALPYLLGYRPEDSIVLVAVGGRDGRGRFGGRCGGCGGGREGGCECGRAQGAARCEERHWISLRVKGVEWRRTSNHRGLLSGNSRAHTKCRTAVCLTRPSRRPA